MVSDKAAWALGVTSYLNEVCCGLVTGTTWYIAYAKSRVRFEDGEEEWVGQK